MKFFIPDVDDNEQEKVLGGIKKFAAEQTGWDIGDKKVYKLVYRHDGKKYESEVGELEDESLGGEKVIAILESNTFLVCTPNRGVLRGMPCLVRLNEVISIDYFDE